MDENITFSFSYTQNLTTVNREFNETGYVNSVYVRYTLIAYTVMIVFGIPGHILSILTITKTSLRNTARASLCVMLSIVDSCFLITQYIRMAGHHIHQNDYVNESKLICKFGDFSFIYFAHMDAFMIVFISIERLLAVHKPHLVKKLITPTKAKGAIWILAAFFLFLDGETIIR